MAGSAATIMTQVMNNPTVFLAGAVAGAVAKWFLMDRNKKNNQPF